jgi:hypothetical protein
MQNLHNHGRQAAARACPLIPAAWRVIRGPRIVRSWSRLADLVAVDLVAVDLVAVDLVPGGRMGCARSCRRAP